MRVMVDTNVIISAILNEDSLSDTVLNEVCENHELILCDYIISEWSARVKCIARIFYFTY
ncbi:MAG: hypothetical protein WA120_06880 [Candidatus Hydromicrobium sp.]